jgi:hypothetical protein
MLVDKFTHESQFPGGLISYQDFDEEYSKGLFPDLQNQLKQLIDITIIFTGVNTPIWDDIHERRFLLRTRKNVS